jgi:hypothetical protein
MYYQLLVLEDLLLMSRAGQLRYSMEDKSAGEINNVVGSSILLFLPVRPI